MPKEKEEYWFTHSARRDSSAVIILPRRGESPLFSAQPLERQKLGIPDAGQTLIALLVAFKSSRWD